MPTIHLQLLPHPATCNGTFIFHDCVPSCAVEPAESGSDSDSDSCPCPSRCLGCDCDCDCDCGSDSHSHFHSGCGCGCGCGCRFRFCYGDGLCFCYGSCCRTTSSAGAWILTCCAHEYMDGLCEL